MGFSTFSASPPSNIIQIISNFSAGSSTTLGIYVDITGANISITPRNATSTIILITSMFINVSLQSTNTTMFIQLSKDAVAIEEEQMGWRFQAIGNQSSQAFMKMYTFVAGTTDPITFSFQQKGVSAALLPTVTSSNISMVAWELTI